MRLYIWKSGTIDYKGDVQRFANRDREGQKETETIIKRRVAGTHEQSGRQTETDTHTHTRTD